MASSSLPPAPPVLAGSGVAPPPSLPSPLNGISPPPQVYIAAFAVSAYSSTYHRAGCKPFNPVLGETYECERPDRGFRFISEQVCAPEEGGGPHGRSGPGGERRADGSVPGAVPRGGGSTEGPLLWGVPGRVWGAGSKQGVTVPCSRAWKLPGCRSAPRGRRTLGADHELSVEGGTRSTTVGAGWRMECSRQCKGTDGARLGRARDAAEDEPGPNPEEPCR